MPGGGGAAQLGGGVAGGKRAPGAPPGKRGKPSEVRWCRFVVLVCAERNFVSLGS